MGWKLKAIAMTAVFVFSVAPAAAGAQQYPPQDCPGSSQGHGNAGGSDTCPGNSSHNAHAARGTESSRADHGDSGDVLGASYTRGSESARSDALAFTGAEIAGISAVGLASLLAGIALVLRVRSEGQRRRSLTTL